MFFIVIELGLEYCSDVVVFLMVCISKFVMFVRLLLSRWLWWFKVMVVVVCLRSFCMILILVFVLIVSDVVVCFSLCGIRLVMLIVLYFLLKVLWYFLIGRCLLW